MGIKPENAIAAKFLTILFRLEEVQIYEEGIWNLK